MRKRREVLVSSLKRFLVQTLKTEFGSVFIFQNHLNLINSEYISKDLIQNQLDVTIRHSQLLIACIKSTNTSFLENEFSSIESIIDNPAKVIASEETILFSLIQKSTLYRNAIELANKIGDKNISKILAKILNEKGVMMDQVTNYRTQDVMNLDPKLLSFKIA